LLASLAKDTVWVSSAEKFNDIFDCKYQDDGLFGIDEAEEIRAINKFREEKKIVAPIQIPDGKLTEENVEEIRGSYEERNRKFLDSFGIYSMSEACNSLLLWSHYAANHFGLCIEYEIDTDDHDLLVPVIYSSQYPKLNLYSFHGDIGKSTVNILRTKSLEWSYEKEWRYISTKHMDCEIGNPFKISGIIFGARMPDADKETIKAVLNKKKVKYFDSVQSTEQFKVSRVEI